MKRKKKRKAMIESDTIRGRTGSPGIQHSVILTGVPEEKCAAQSSR